MERKSRKSEPAYNPNQDLARADSVESGTGVTVVPRRGGFSAAYGARVLGKTTTRRGEQVVLVERVGGGRTHIAGRTAVKVR